MASENPSVGFVLKAYRKLSIEANKLVDLKHELEKALNFLLEGKDFLRFYAEIQASPAPGPQELSKFFADLSVEHGHEFNGDQALQELYDYVRRYQDQLQEALEESELPSLASKLEHVIATISDD